MTPLLDTHVFFWCVRRGSAVPAHVAEALREAPRRMVSDVSAFEVSLKVGIGKFGEAAPLRDNWASALSRLPALALPVATEPALLAGTLAWAHRDPFDRLLAAQALTNDLTLVTADDAFSDVPGLSVLRW